MEKTKEGVLPQKFYPCPNCEHWKDVYGDGIVHTCKKNIIPTKHCNQYKPKTKHNTSHNHN